MGDLAPVAVDIETTDIYPTTGRLTVVGLAHQLGCIVVLNTGGRPAHRDELLATLEQHAHIRDFTLVDDEAAFLDALDDAIGHLDPDTHYLTAFNGERWRGGFDLKFLRTKAAFNDHGWPFAEFAYADTMDMVERFATDDNSDLDGCYEVLVGDDTCDPFEDSAEAVDAWEHGEWTDLLLHNMADIQQTLELAMLAEQYVPNSDFSMKSLSPPGR